MVGAFSASDACFARDKSSSTRVWWRWSWPEAAQATFFVALHSADSRENCSKRCWEKKNIVDTMGCCRLPLCDTRCWWAGLSMCHAELRREVPAVIAAKLASALLWDSAVLYQVPGMDMWACVHFSGHFTDRVTSRRSDQVRVSRTES